MGRTAVQRAQMNVGARGLRETLKKVFGKLGLKIADAFCGDFCMDDTIGSAAEIHGGSGEGFIHGHQEVSGAENAAFCP
jgi:hypothetical protein